MANVRSRRIVDSFKDGKKCPYCPKGFFKADHFHRHLRSHTKEKPFPCKTCGKAYPRHDTMLRHMRTHHKDQNQEDRISNSDGANADARRERTPALDMSWTGETDSVLFPQQSSRGLQGHAAFDGEFADEEMSGQNVQSLINGARRDGLARGNGMSIPQDAGQPSSFSPEQQHSTASHVTYTGESSFAAHSQHEIPTRSSVGAADDFNDWVDPMGWLLEDDYSLNNFTQFMTPNNHVQFDICQTDQSNALGPITADQSTRRTCADHTHRKIPDLRHCWYTQVSAADGPHGSLSRCVSPPVEQNQSNDDIDESYRASAASKLRSQPRTDPLPSTGLLNLFIHLFFTRFNVALPLIHGPTFRPTKENALLVLSICSAGSLFFGSEEATHAGSMLFERVNKAILGSSWEKNLLRYPRVGLNTLKAACIGQTFGLLSGNPLHLETAGCFHGSVIALARRLRISDTTSEIPFETNPSSSQLHSMWIKWARSEERKRLAVCLYVHDAEIADVFHHEPFLRHKTKCLPPLAPSELFNAPSAEVWYSRLRAERDQSARPGTIFQTLDPFSFQNATANTAGALNYPDEPPCSLETYSMLSGIGASISASRRLGALTMECQTQYEAELLTAYEKLTTLSYKWTLLENGTPQLILNSLALWHYTWISLYVDLNTLELAIGREGSDVSTTTIDYVESWVKTRDSLRCLLHAWLLQDCMAQIPSGSVMAIHSPRILFSAAIIWQCYISYQPKSFSATSKNLQIDSSLVSYLRFLPEIQIMSCEPKCPHSSRNARFRALDTCFADDNISRLQDVLATVLTQIKQQTLHSVADTLRRTISYGIARKMADIIEVLLSHAINSADENYDHGGPRQAD